MLREYEILWAWLLLVLALLTFVLLIGLTFVFYRKVNEHIRMRTASMPLLIASFSMIVWGPFLALSKLTQLTDWISYDYNVAIYLLGYALYFLFWMLGMGRYLQNTIKLPKNRRKRFNQAITYLRYIALFTTVLAIVTVIMLIYEIFPTTITYLVYLVLALLATSIFVFFKRTFQREREKNASKLIKARLDLLDRSMLFQLGISLIIVAGAVVNGLELIPSLTFSQLLVFTPILILSVYTNIYLYWASDIPSHIRQKYDITPKRFEFVRKAEKL